MNFKVILISNWFFTREPLHLQIYAQNTIFAYVILIDTRGLHQRLLVHESIKRLPNLTYPTSNGESDIFCGFIIEKNSACNSFEIIIAHKCAIIMFYRDVPKEISTSRISLLLNHHSRILFEVEKAIFGESVQKHMCRQKWLLCINLHKKSIWSQYDIQYPCQGHDQVQDCVNVVQSAAS